MIDFCEDKELQKKLEKEITRFSSQKLKGNIVFAKGNRIEAFLLSDELYKNFKSMERNPYSIGAFLGSFEGERFSPSLQLLHNIAISDDVRAVVNRRGEKPFLYGKNVESRDVVWISEETMPGEILVLCNEKNEPIGFVKSLTNGRIMKKLGNKPVLKNIQDIGWYLRKGR